MSLTVTLITGAKKGIGKFLVHHYVQKGHHVIGCSREKPDWTLDNYTHFCLDVADEPAVVKMFATIRAQFGLVHHLINNAGIASMNHSMLTPVGVLDRILKTNVIGTFLCSREAAKVMKKGQFGRIVNFTTIAAPLKLEGEAIYAASKSAVLTLTEVLAREYAAFGITVNAVGPSPIETDLTRTIPTEKLNQLLQRQAIKRMGTFEDVAQVVDFYISKKSGFITGQVNYLGGV